MASYGKDFEDKIFDAYEIILENKRNEAFFNAIEVLKKAWDELPEPKCCYNESFLISYWLTDVGINMHDEAMMKEWIQYIFEADLERADIGEREELAGEVAYECGNLEEAFDYFKIAVQKSMGGRCFGGRNKKYKKFYLDRK